MRTASDDHSRERVDDEADVGDPVAAGHEGQVDDPRLVRALGDVLAVHQIGMPIGGLIAARGEDLLGPVHLRMSSWRTERAT